MAKDIGLLQWLWGLSYVLRDCLMQLFWCRHLPKRIPLPALSHFTCIVTGATSGIGLEIAREFAQSGAHVVLAVRNTANGEKVVQKWTKEQEILGVEKLNAEVMELDLLSLASVRTFAKKWEDRQLPLHALINNAGIFAMGVKQKFSEDGFEHHLQVNHLGSALLSMLLLPSLRRGAPSRIVNVNSIMHYAGFVDPEDLNITKRGFGAVAGYCGSKLAQVLFSRVLQTKIPSEAGVDVILVHPGEVMSGVTRDLPAIIRKMEIVSKIFRLSPQEGARSVIFCATDKQVFSYARALRGMGNPIAPYFSMDCKPSRVSKQAEDLEMAKRIWLKTLELLKLPHNFVEKQLEDNTGIETNYREKLRLMQDMEPGGHFGDISRISGALCSAFPIDFKVLPSHFSRLFRWII